MQTQAEELLKQWRAEEDFQKLLDVSIYREISDESFFVFVDGSGIFVHYRRGCEAIEPRFEARLMDAQELKTFRFREILKSAVQKLVIAKPGLLRPMAPFEYSRPEWDAPLADLEESLSKTGISDAISVNFIACEFMCELCNHA